MSASRIARLQNNTNVIDSIHDDGELGLVKLFASYGIKNVGSYEPRIRSWEQDAWR
jgi:hypothetical protein